MDEVIFEEFKGTGNMELQLERKTVQQAYFTLLLISWPPLPVVMICCLKEMYCSG